MQSLASHQAGKRINNGCSWNCAPRAPVSAAFHPCCHHQISVEGAGYQMAVSCPTMASLLRLLSPSPLSWRGQGQLPHPRSSGEACVSFDESQHGSSVWTACWCPTLCAPSAPRQRELAATPTSCAWSTWGLASGSAAADGKARRDGENKAGVSGPFQHRTFVQRWPHRVAPGLGIQRVTEQSRKVLENSFLQHCTIIPPLSAR